MSNSDGCLPSAVPFYNPNAIRKTVSGVIEGPISFFWNVEKAN